MTKHKKLTDIDKLKSKFQRKLNRQTKEFNLIKNKNEFRKKQNRYDALFKALCQMIYNEIYCKIVNSIKDLTEKEMKEIEAKYTLWLKENKGRNFK